jgi:hypothetical protein
MLPALALLCAAMPASAALNAGSVDFPDDLEKWIAVDPPENGSDGWLVATNDVEHLWRVTLRDRRPRAELCSGSVQSPAPLPFEINPGSAREGLSGRRFSANVADGWIVAFNAGEFGAGLWWFSPDGKKRQKIAEAWVSGFIATEAGSLALEGLAHGLESRGRIIRLVPDPRNGWRSEELVDLKHAPEAAVKTVDGSLLVATTDRLLRVFPTDKKVEVLLKDAFWRGLYPNSIVVTPDGTTYLGMRHGVSKIEKKGEAYKSIWLLPNPEFVDMKPLEGFQ